MVELKHRWRLVRVRSSAGLSLMLFAWVGLGAVPTRPELTHGTSPIILWVSGAVKVTSQLSAPGDSPDAVRWMDEGPAVVGSELGATSALELPKASSVSLLVARDRLMRVTGPGRCVGSPTPTCEAASVSREPLGDYRESPMTLMPPPTSQPPAETPALDRGLSVRSPSRTTILADHPEIRWRWTGSGGRFDLELTRIDGEERPVERWSGLDGRSLTLWAPLTRGGRYRIRISLAGPAPVGREVVDELEFGVLGPVEARAVKGALAALDAVERAAEAPRPSVEVLRARLLESYGLLGEAERIWAALALLHPDRPELGYHARRLHQQVHD